MISSKNNENRMAHTTCSSYLIFTAIEINCDDDAAAAASDAATDETD